LHVAIVGAGALGRVYGVRLALLAGAGVTFVVRPGKEDDKSPFAIVRVDADHEEHVLRAPDRAARIPAHADVILLCVRVEQLDDPMVKTLAEAANVPIVVLTPMMPADFERLTRGLGPRVLAGMPGVVSYINPAGACRYWLPRVAPTLIDEPRPALPAVSELVGLLARAGVVARLELGVHETNPATTVCFIPIMMGLDAAGSIQALLADRSLLDVALRSTHEGEALSRRIGKSAPWVRAFRHFVGPTTLRVGVALARRQWPEAVSYVEEHFGRKLHVQNVVMAEAMVRLAHDKGSPHEALDGLLARLRSTPSGS
jgi:hypothetical protein